jgi:phage repressor protein C with HTH and peptisase S24 domain
VLPRSGAAIAPIVFRCEWFERRGFDPTKLLAARALNGSIEPGIYDGDTVVINVADITPKDGAVFAAHYEGELVVKRLVRDSGQ